MSRVFWLAVGATAGVYVVRKVTKKAHALTPAGVAERADALGYSLRSFADQVRAGMVEREAELRDALGITDRHDRPLESADDATDRPAAVRRATG